MDENKKEKKKLDPYYDLCPNCHGELVYDVDIKMDVCSKCGLLVDMSPFDLLDFYQYKSFMMDYKNVPQSELEFENEMCFCCGHNKGEELFNQKDDDYDDMINYQLEPSDELMNWQLEHNND